MQKLNVALVSGFWAQNIGNAFFNLGGKFILDNVFDQHDVNYFQDQPGYWTLNFRKNPKNSKEDSSWHLIIIGPDNDNPGPR